MRRRQHHIDATVTKTAVGWALSFKRNDRPLLTWTFADRDLAVGDAERRLRDLLRAG